ncbi:hypothetical protein [Rhizobium laguerreae]|uniref:hypothetical protein n=1 Tax=Rhizobium laguerreae TaxID=1076926 RepID=UPI001C922303|nr:hypothetical protein [Rhizobium laguerreae]MBY3381694.1 hypothetical protein [Rhizobium laguerreae]
MSKAIAACFKAPTPRLPRNGFALIVSRWVVRDDDLKLYEEFVKAISAAAGATFFLDQTKILAAGVGVGVAVFSIFRNAWKSSAVLSPDEVAVLWALRREHPHRPRKADLVTLLAESTRIEGWSEEAVQRILDKLEKYPAPTGLKKFVACDGQGGWGLEGV